MNFPLSNLVRDIWRTNRSDRADLKSLKGMVERVKSKFNGKYWLNFIDNHDYP